MHAHAISGAGLGLRRALTGPLAELGSGRPDFLEVTPENWIGIGGRIGRDMAWFAERYPLVCHGLSLSLGGQEPLDRRFIADLKGFLDQHGVRIFSEHLSYCADAGHLYDLMPLPFTEEAVRHVAGRIRQAQDLLGRRIAVENVSYYAAPGQRMSELDFLNAVVAEADCDLLLDVNNVYVNAANHGYDPYAFIDGMPAERVAYLHMAGHYQESDDLIIDTHGAPVIDPVWQLLAHTYRRLGTVPTLLERDFNLPPLNELLAEVDTIRRAQQQTTEVAHETVAG